MKPQINDVRPEATYHVSATGARLSVDLLA